MRLLFLSILSACSGNNAAKACAWEVSSWDSTASFHGHSPQALSDQWAGVHHYRTDGLPVSTVAVPESSLAYTSGWTVGLEPAGPPVLRESWDCGSHVAIPFNWAIRLAGGQVESWGRGSQTLNNGRGEGQVSIIGELEEDVILALSPELGDSTATADFYSDYGRDNSVQPSLSLRSAGGVTILTAFQLHPTEASHSIRMVALKERP